MQVIQLISESRMIEQTVAPGNPSICNGMDYFLVCYHGNTVQPRNRGPNYGQTMKQQFSHINAMFFFRVFEGGTSKNKDNIESDPKKGKTFAPLCSHVRDRI